MNPRSEHPRPQFQPRQWINLNGKWNFCIDHGDSGRQAHWHEHPSVLTDKMRVPFCPESRLSGIGHTDFMPAVWYYRPIEEPDQWSGQRVRLHQQVFEERFHYWAHRLGYLTWGEFADWGLDFGQPQALANQQREWREIVLRDLNHPSIVAWTPFNETIGAARSHREAHRRALESTYDLTRALDTSRPVHDASGYVHVKTDIFTVHDCDHNPDTFCETYRSVHPNRTEQARVCFPELSVPYRGQPYLVDEYGGTWWVESSASDGTDRDAGWGYGNRPQRIEEVYERIEKLTGVLTAHPHMAGFTYTQLTDIEQEQNGIYTYDRTLKFDAERLRSAFGAAAAIEGKIE